MQSTKQAFTNATKGQNNSIYKKVLIKYLEALFDHGMNYTIPLLCLIYNTIAKVEPR